MTMNNKQRAGVKNQRIKQSSWEAKLGRKRSSEKISFKFLMKLKVTAGKAQVEIWSEYRVVLTKVFWQGVP
jgi:hypothetical protein